MMTLIVAAAAAAAQPAAPATAEHQVPMMQMGQAGEHKAMDCCKDMAGKDAEHKGHPAQ
jgi:hypothetical protein